MGFIRENILKIITIIIIFIVVVVIFTFLFKGDNSTKAKTYFQLEDKLKIATQKYVNKHKDLLPKNDQEQSKINLSTLIQSKTIKNIYSIEDEKVECNGYTTILMKNNKYKYVPYLKCGKYYETKSISDYIISMGLVTSDDGLYKIDNKYVFRGENPKNYLIIDERLYRIIEIDEDNQIKLISTKKYTKSTTWDNRYNVDRSKNDGLNDYSKSRLKDTLEEAYMSDYFSDTEKKFMIPHSVCIGKKYLNDNSIDGSSECSNKIDNQYVSLMYVSEYMRASIDTHCMSSNNYVCSNYNYFSTINSSFRTITAVADNSYQVYTISAGKSNVVRASATFSFYPIIYIDKLSLYSGGDGTIEHPYMVR